MEEYGSISSIILPAILVAAGYGARLLIERFTRRKDWLAEERGKAYLRFVEAVATAAHGKSNRGVAEAKAHIGVLGSKPVVESLYQFELTERHTADTHSQKSFLAVVAAMRSDLMVGEVMQDQLSKVLFGPDRR